ncbi:hypothetical protein U9M48_037442 [Paspalum notatum var. saurae]|uniref:Uncharacterized protein n=1 Tax=Paspalum notatum var. saurae TaxID=547442 RepID=A0AAQ3UFL9_PASNO
MLVAHAAGAARRPSSTPPPGTGPAGGALAARPHYPRSATATRAVAAVGPPSNPAPLPTAAASTTTCGHRRPLCPPPAPPPRPPPTAGLCEREEEDISHATAHQPSCSPNCGWARPGTRTKLTWEGGVEGLDRST